MLIAVDSMLATPGPERFTPLGLANVAEDVHGTYDEWAEGVWRGFPMVEVVKTPPLDLQILSPPLRKFEQDMVDVVC